MIEAKPAAVVSDSANLFAFDVQRELGMADRGACTGVNDDACDRIIGVGVLRSSFRQKSEG